jgi:hypothetical protein
MLIIAGIWPHAKLIKGPTIYVGTEYIESA